MKKGFMRFMIVFLLFFSGACSIVYVDEICLETTGEGGNLVLDIDNFSLFH